MSNIYIYSPSKLVSHYSTNPFYVVPSFCCLFEHTAHCVLLTAGHVTLPLGWGERSNLSPNHLKNESTSMSTIHCSTIRWMRGSRVDIWMQSWCNILWSTLWFPILVFSLIFILLFMSCLFSFDADCTKLFCKKSVLEWGKSVSNTDFASCLSCKELRGL